MKSTLSQRRSSPSTSSLVLASAAILLTGYPQCSNAASNNLRRSSASSAIADNNSATDAASSPDFVEDGFEVVSSNDSYPRQLQPLDNERPDAADDQGFEAVGGPVDHDPLVMQYSAEGWHRSMLLDDWNDPEEAEEYVEPKEYINDETLTFVDPDEYLHERNERNCGDDEKLWLFKFRTDDYGYESSWDLERQNDDGEWNTITAGPPGNSKYQDNTVYQGATCLPGGFMYRLTIKDDYGDGFCCQFGRGYYLYKVGGLEQYNSNQEPTFNDKAQHQFYVGLPTPEEPTPDESPGNGNPPFTGKGGGDISCPANEQEIKIKIFADKYGAENSWELKNKDTGDVIFSVPLNTYGRFGEDEKSACVPFGNYHFIMTDTVGDGICCKEGKGRYEIYMDGKLIIYGSDFNFGKLVEHKIIVGYDDTYNLEGNMSQREKEYLDGHNWRRKKYHEEFGAEYVPLRYDLGLARHAKKWADMLLGDCHIPGIEHEPGVTQGENLAKNTGNGGYGQLYPVENICRRWFEREEDWPYPDNAHFTQGLWRTAFYLGCAESEKTMPNGGTCRIQVCRYARAGNCDMGTHKATVGKNWKKPMLMDENPCGPVCGPDGCHG
mmetsp:Transcript_12492/g.26593  ORF Transcript_12492/g.26593 Transcript_12492/m.26593 type:complete len:607 (+) Transcript_12492:312-2132(+)|eukprot:CAMPEP_0183728366 /NCGR_PEP_ID=MMETSP0737-20130205/27862_1 /TAXON_ID=385413 /ORGANISM="Thalassiosira miniscula, Strain CCMP1093" /LENGTH=606 /DNA_ID=CAMNT_0025960287 /DNA_START=216 /DNA_END=2036 /DNA_ORIENTATION=+